MWRSKHRDVDTGRVYARIRRLLAGAGIVLLPAARLAVTRPF